MEWRTIETITSRNRQYANLYLTLSDVGSRYTDEGGQNGKARLFLFLEEDRLILTAILDVLREALEELWILSFVDGSKGRCGHPTARIHNGAVGDLASQMIARHRTTVGRWLDRRLAHEANRQRNSHHFPVVGLLKSKKIIL